MIWGRIKCPEQSLSAAQRPPARKLSLSVLNADRLIMFRAILRLLWSVRNVACTPRSSRSLDRPFFRY